MNMHMKADCNDQVGGVLKHVAHIVHGALISNCAQNQTHQGRQYSENMILRGRLIRMLKRFNVLNMIGVCGCWC